MKVYKITWRDAVGEDVGWTDLEIVKKEHVCDVHSVGFVISEKEDCITLCMSFEPENEKVGAYLTIPKALIVEQIEL